MPTPKQCDSSLYHCPHLLHCVPRTLSPSLASLSPSSFSCTSCSSLAHRFHIPLFTTLSRSSSLPHIPLHSITSPSSRYSILQLNSSPPLPRSLGPWSKTISDATLTNSNFKTALDLACEFGRCRVVDLLLQSDLCDSILHDDDGDQSLLNNKEKSSCLHLAAKNGHIDVIRLLLGNINVTVQLKVHLCQLPLIRHWLSFVIYMTGHLCHWLHIERPSCSKINVR